MLHLIPVISNEPKKKKKFYILQLDYRLVVFIIVIYIYFLQINEVNREILKNVSSFL